MKPLPCWSLLVGAGWARLGWGLCGEWDAAAAADPGVAALLVVAAVAAAGG